MEAMPGLGRRRAIDDRDFKARRLLEAEPLPEPERPWRYWWSAYEHRNQGGTGTCVGHAWSHLLNADVDPFEIYDRAVQIDEWDDNDHDPQRIFGTSVRAGGQALREKGLIEAFAFTWELDAAVNWLLTRGPLIVGSWWYSGMSDRDHDGFLWPQGARVGGHAWLVDGVNLEKKRARAMQSWDYGPFYITLDVLQLLIEDEGEAAMPIEASKRAIVVPN